MGDTVPLVPAKTSSTLNRKRTRKRCPEWEEIEQAHFFITQIGVPVSVDDEPNRSRLAARILWFIYGQVRQSAPAFKPGPAEALAKAWRKSDGKSHNDSCSCRACSAAREILCA